MRFATLVVEQLDRAATELAVNHPLNARIALILIDNGAELLIHRRCADLVRADQRSGMPVLTAAKSRAILGQWFAEKIKYLEQQGAISSSERHFINELHSQRNVLYHVGLTNDDIVRPLAIAYFRFSCELLPRFDNRSLCWPRELNISPSLHRYFPDAARGSHFPGFDATHVARCLLDRVPADAPPLAVALSAHSEAVVGQTQAKFEQIQYGLDKKSSPDGTFRQLQHDSDFQTLIRERMRKVGKEDKYIPFGHPVLNEFATKVMPDWKPRYTKPPFEKWRGRARAVGKCSDPLSSVQKFTELRSEMEYLAEAIDDAHEIFWGWVQQQEDAAQDAR